MHRKVLIQYSQSSIAAWKILVPMKHMLIFNSPIASSVKVLTVNHFSFSLSLASLSLIFWYFVQVVISSRCFAWHLCHRHPTCHLGFCNLSFLVLRYLLNLSGHHHRLYWWNAYSFCSQAFFFLGFASMIQKVLWAVCFIKGFVFVIFSRFEHSSSSLHMRDRSCHPTPLCPYVPNIVVFVVIIILSACRKLFVMLPYSFSI